MSWDATPQGIVGSSSRSDSSLSSEDSDDDDGFGGKTWMLMNIREVAGALRNERIGPAILNAIRSELHKAFDIVETQLQRTRATGGPQDDLEPRRYTPLLDEYLSRVGDLDSAREEYDSYVRAIQEEPKDEHKIEKQKALLEDMGTVFKDVKYLEEQCKDEDSLNPLRDEEETIPFLVSIDGLEERRSYLKPSPYWHERLHTGQFAIVKAEPKKNKNLNDVENINSGDDDAHLVLPPPRYPPPPPPYPPPAYSDSRVFPDNEASHKHLLESSIAKPMSTPNPIPLSTRPAQGARPLAAAMANNLTETAPSAHSTMIQDILKSIHCVWAPNADLKGIMADSSIRTVICEVSWELPRFFKAHFPPDSQLRNVLTVTGDATTAYACSCEEYITRFLGRGRLLLEAIEKLLAHENRGHAIDGEVTISIIQNVDKRSTPEQPVPLSAPQHNLESFVSSCTIEITASFRDQVEIANSILWICSAIRYSPAGLKLSRFSSSLTNQPQDKTYCISPQPLRATLDDNMTKPCWHGLFKDQVIAHGFPIPGRTAGKGLELSFDNMIALARSIELVVVDKGFVAEGLTTLLVPTLKLGPSDGNAIQWHLYQNKREEDNIDQAELGLLGPKLIAELSTGSLAKNYHRESSPEVLSSQTAFLGWVPSARVVVGSSESALNVDESGIPEIKEVKNKWTLGGSFGLVTKPFSAALTFAATPSAMASAVVQEDELVIKSTLHRASNARVAIIYDSSKKIGWLIPRANLILYLAQLLLCQTWKLLPSDFKYAFPPPAIDGGSAASKALWTARNQDLPKVVYDIDKKSKPKQLLWLIEKICLHLRKVEGSLVQLRGEAGTANTKAPKSLIGVELLQVVHFEVIRPKEVEFNQPWAHIAEQEPLVLFCSGLGQAIQPTFTAFSEGALCRTWCNPGIESFGEEVGHYLIATGRTVMCLLNRNRSGEFTRLSPSIRWKLDNPSPLFSLHKYRVGESYCHHAQLLESTKDHDAESERRTGLVVQHHLDGAFVFTRRTYSNILSTRPSRIPCAASPQEPALYSSITSTDTPNLLASTRTHIQSSSSKLSSTSKESNLHMVSNNRNSPHASSISPILTNKYAYYDPDPQVPVQIRPSSTESHNISQIVKDQSPHKLRRESRRFSHSHLPTNELQSISSSTVSDVSIVTAIHEPPHAAVGKEKQKSSHSEQNFLDKNTRHPKRRSSKSKDNSKGSSREGDKRQHGNSYQDRGRKP